MDNVEQRAERDAGQSTSDFTLTDMIGAVWGARAWLFAGVVLAVCISVAMTLARRISTMDTQTNYYIEFTFDGRSDNKYPNGTPFSVSDIISPSVVSEVYEQERLADAGYTLRDFQLALSVSPYAPTRQLILDKYNQAIDPRKATVAELQEAQASLERELSAASNRYAVISFSEDDTVLPPAKVASILTRVAQVWEKNAIGSRGVLKFDIKAVDPSVFTQDNIAGVGRLAALNFIDNNVASLRKFLDSVAELPGGNLLRDPETGLNVQGLQQQVNRAALQLVELPADWNGASPGQQAQPLGMPISLYSGRLFDAAQLEDLDYLIAIDLVRERINLLRQNIRQITDKESGDLAVDPETHLAARDVDRLLFDLDDVSLKQLSTPVLALGIAKNPVVIDLYYKARLQELKRQKDTLASKARVLEQANQNYQGMMGGSSQPGQPGTSEFPSTGSTVIPQFGDAFLDRIISLAQKGGDTQFRQELLQKTVDFQQQATDVDAEIGRVEEYLRVFSQATNSSSPGDVALREQFTKQINERLPDVMNKLKEYTEITRRIALRLRLAEDIHSIAVDQNPELANDPNQPTDERLRVGVDFYLRDVPSEVGLNTTSILGQLKACAEAANRIYAQASTAALGTYMKLFRPTAEPQQVRRPLISRFDLLMVALGGVVGLLVGGACAFLFALNRRRRTAQALGASNLS